MICPHCRAVFPDGGRCWNCQPARPVRPEDLPEDPGGPLAAVHEDLLRKLGRIP